MAKVPQNQLPSLYSGIQCIFNASPGHFKRWIKLNARRVIDIFSKLASCSSSKELSKTMQDIIREDFQDSLLKVYEMVPARTEDNSHNTSFIYKDTDTSELVGRVEENENYRTPVETKTPSSAKISDNKNETAIPIVLSDVNVSHLVSLTYNENELDDNELLIQIVLAFSAMFKTLHEKNYDQLTRVLNRQAFDQACLDSEYFGASSENNSISPFSAIAVIDIDRFKSINDTFGHAIGDEVLVLFCQIICSVIRDEDRFFRYGGEEFVLFLRGKNDFNPDAVLERCREAIQEKTFPQVGKLTVSIGFTKIETDVHPMNLFLKADRALYYSKNNGRNQVNCYEHILSENLIKAVEDNDNNSEFWDE